MVIAAELDANECKNSRRASYDDRGPDLADMNSSALTFRFARVPGRTERRVAASVAVEPHHRHLGGLNSLPLRPTMMILLLEMATASAWSFPLNPICCLPSPLNVPSSRPLVFSRATAKLKSPPKPRKPDSKLFPTTTIFPPPCRAMSVAPPAKSITRLPSPTD